MDNDAELTDLVRAGRAIDAIKLIRERDSCSLIEAKERYEALRESMRAAGTLDAGPAAGMNTGGKQNGLESLDARPRSGCFGLLLLVIVPAVGWLAI